MRTLIGMAFLSAAALMLQVALTRVFSIAQFYHFAFLVVSLALLGFGASGSLLTLFPSLRSQHMSAWYALGFALTTVLAYLFLNHQPADTYSIAWDRQQVYLLIGNLLGLAVPFTSAGAVIGLLLSHESERAGRIYGTNLVGSALGAMLAPLTINAIGSERVVLTCALLGAIASLVLAQKQRLVTGLALVGVFVSGMLLISFPADFEIQISQYKTLHHYYLNPDAEIVTSRENAYSRLDIIQSSTIHSAQGMSMNYFGDLPPQAGLLIDGDALLPVPDTNRASKALAHNMPMAVASQLHPQADTLILGAGGGMDPWAALMNGAQRVTVIEPNRLIYEALTDDLRDWYGLANRVDFRHEEIRTFAQRTDHDYDIVQLSLTDPNRPITSGAFTLTEDYLLTVEAFKAYLELCGDDGLLVLSRWFQTTPSESLRTLAIILEALNSDTPLIKIVAFRTFQLTTFIVKPGSFTDTEIDTLLGAIADLRYDLVLAPEMPTEMINQYARLDTPIYHDTFLELVNAEDREQFYDNYPFRVEPTTDDRPFFFHFFKWGQTPAILDNLGRNWQPFGGSGYFVLVALLIFALTAAATFIVTPIAARRRFRQALNERGSVRILGYFTAIGLAFLLIEVALIQQYMLILGHPTLAVATVIGVLLFTSGVGSPLAHHFRWRHSLIALVILIAISPVLTDALKPVLLTLPQLPRLLLVISLIAPLGFLMGMPFTRGVMALSNNPQLVPWAWAVNGSASVTSAVLAVILALSFGFTGVTLIGGLLYLLAGLLSQYDIDEE